MRTSLKILGSAWAGTLLMACSTVSVATYEHETVLEQACLDDPLNAQNWERLGAALQANGQAGRALVMFKQAAALREHDIRKDIGVLPPETVTALAKTAPDDTMDRIELVQTGAAMVELRRIPAAHAPPSVPLPAADETPLRLEISNGNGVTGLAARWARKLKGKDIRVVRLSNVRPFAVPASRIEYPRNQEAAARALSEKINVPLLAQCDHCTPADVRIVLGHDRMHTGAP